MENVRKNCRGTALIEFALVLPLLVVLVFGTIDGARIFATWNRVKNAAHEGASFAQFFPLQQSQVGAACASPNNINARARAEGSDLTVAVSPAVTPACQTMTSASVVQPGQTVTVTASDAVCLPHAARRRAVGQSHGSGVGEGDSPGMIRSILRARTQRGAVTVEFAFVAPLVLLFLIGAVQVGLVVIGNAVGSNAAREGGRTATIRYECADNHVSARCPVTPSTNYGVIKAAVMARLSGLVQPSSVDVAVKCRQGSATGPVILCEKSTVNPDTDVVEVAVTWDHVGVTAWAPGTTHSSTARMVIVGRPDLSSLVPEPDGYAPGLASGIVVTDPNVDGVLDTVTMTFDEDIAQSASTAAFTVANSPTGSNSITLATVSGRVVTLKLAGSTVNTAPGSMTVSLSASPSGVVDQFGNQAEFAATAVADGAGPVLVGLTDTPGLINGRPGALDTATLTFSEPIATALSTTSVVLTDPLGGGNDSVAIAGISAGPQLTNSDGYNTSNNSSVSVSALGDEVRQLRHRDDPVAAAVLPALVHRPRDGLRLVAVLVHAVYVAGRRRGQHGSGQPHHQQHLLRGTHMKRTRKNERGSTLILVSLSLAASISVVGVVVDGGSAFAERRQMQNAADAAALSAARAFDRVVAGQESTIWTAALNTAAANGASSSTVTCKLVDEVLTEIASCPTTNNGTAPAIKALAAGVRVTVSATKPTNFIRVAGIEQFTAGGRAAAQVQGLRSGSSPFVLCAVGDSDPRSLGDGQAIPIILPDNSTNPAAIGVTYELQDPTTVGCGQSNSFKGLSDSPDTVTTPGPWVLENGDHGINVAKAIIAGNKACNGVLEPGCIVAVPLCHATAPPQEGVLYCERFGAFEIDDDSTSSRIMGTLRNGVVATGGLGGSKPLEGELRVIKLSE